MNQAHNNTTTLAYHFTALAGLDTDRMPQGWRKVSVVRKGTHDDGSKKVSQGCFIPVLTAQGMREILEVEKVQRYLMHHFGELQDMICRGYIEGGSYSVPIDALSNEALIEHISKTLEGIEKERTRSNGGRLSKEGCSKWAREWIAPHIEQVFIERLGSEGAECTREDSRIRGIVDAYCRNFSLIAGLVRMEDGVAVNLIKALDLIPAEVLDGNVEVRGMVDKMLERIEYLTSLPVQNSLDIGMDL